jgi:serine/threonine protein kinase
MSTDDGAPRRTRLYGAIDPSDIYPPTLAESEVMTAVSPEIGDELSRYRIEGVLGRGGMGEVFSARDDQIGRAVAIKRLRVENPSPEVLARFYREARVQGSLEHPAVVPVYELSTDDAKQPFFVMKQVSGTTLADVMPRLVAGDAEALAKFPRQLLLRAFVDVCLAIEFAHARGIVHRDLKPANIALGDFGEVYVLDWGIARVVAERDVAGMFVGVDTARGTETIAGAILGTPGYISPEQVRGDDDLDHRADIYALGCILFEILALEPLHPRREAGLTSALTGSADARPSVRAPLRDIPPELDALCVAATATDRARRPATARELGDTVQRFLDGNRDLAQRKELARAQLEAAHAALASGAGTEARAEAMRAAARALALDPTDRAPADLVGRLMLEPPVEVPAEVVRELRRLDLDSLRRSARFGTFAATAYILFFPLLYWVGFRDTWYLIAGPAVSLFIIWVEIVVAPRNAYLSGYLAIAGNLFMFGLFAWIVSPVVVGPGPGIIIVSLLAAHRQLIRPWLLAALTLLATLAPWLVQLAGYSATRTTIAGGDLILHTVATNLDPFATMIALVIYGLALVFLAALISGLQDEERRGVRRELQLHAWQLRQLVP